MVAYTIRSALNSGIDIIGNRAFAFTRNVRKGDFRASGSGSVEYGAERIDLQSIALAFKVAQKIRAQSVAFDFVKNAAGEPLIVEISYMYMDSFVYACPGHWDRGLIWSEGQVWPQDAILEDLLETVRRKRHS